MSDNMRGYMVVSFCRTVDKLDEGWNLSYSPVIPSRIHKSHDKVQAPARTSPGSPRHLPAEPACYKQIITELSVFCKPNILLITADTLHPDHLGCYGHEGMRTPVIDSLAAHGVLFENARTSISLTLSSHISIMTGLYPPTHGIRFNGDSALSDTLTTLAEILQDQGYSTGAFVGSCALDPDCGLTQGFSAYDAGYVTANPAKKMVHPKLSKAFSRLLLMRALMYILPVDLLFTSEYQRPAELVNKPVLKWLENICISTLWELLTLPRNSDRHGSTREEGLLFGDTFCILSDN